MSAEKVVSVHIEKTAGTSLEKWFMQVFGGHNVLIYSPLTDSLLLGSTVPATNPTVDHARTLLLNTPFVSTFYRGYHWLLKHQERRFDPENLPANFEIVHGHFLANKFDEQLPDAFRTVVLREPLERVVSHYKYWKKIKGHTNHRVKIPFSKDVTFEDFAFAQEVQDYQTQALGGLDLEDFELIGVTQELGLFATSFLTLRNIRMDCPTIPILNKQKTTNDGEELGIDAAFKTRFKKHHERDYYNYAKALNISHTR